METIKQKEFVLPEQVVVALRCDSQRGGAGYFTAKTCKTIQNDAVRTASDGSGAMEPRNMLKIVAVVKAQIEPELQSSRFRSTSSHRSSLQISSFRSPAPRSSFQSFRSSDSKSRARAFGAPASSTAAVQSVYSVGFKIHSSRFQSSSFRSSRSQSYSFQGSSFQRLIVHSCSFELELPELQSSNQSILPSLSFQRFVSQFGTCEIYLHC